MNNQLISKIMSTDIIVVNALNKLSEDYERNPFVFVAWIQRMYVVSVFYVNTCNLV